MYISACSSEETITFYEAMGAELADCPIKEIAEEEPYDEFKSIKGKLIESEDFEKLEDEKLLEEISKEFPAYRRVKVQEGFMQIFGQHLGVVESVEEETFMVRYWELLIPAKGDDSLEEKPEKGSDVQFIWNHKGESRITKVFKNLLEN